MHEAKKRLAAEMHGDSERHDADRKNDIAKLKEENERLKKELGLKGGASPSGNNEEAQAKLREMEEQMRANQMAMDDM